VAEVVADVAVTEVDIAWTWQMTGATIVTKIRHFGCLAVGIGRKTREGGLEGRGMFAGGVWIKMK